MKKRPQSGNQHCLDVTIYKVPCLCGSRRDYMWIAYCRHCSLFTERRAERHTGDVQAALLCQKEDRFNWQTLLLWHRGGGEVRREGGNNAETDDYVEMWLLLDCGPIKLTLSLQTQRHHPASTIWGKQTALDGGNGWKRTCNEYFYPYMI